MCAPTKPVAPVTKTFIRTSPLKSFVYRTEQLSGTGARRAADISESVGPARCYLAAGAFNSERGATLGGVGLSGHLRLVRQLS